MNNSLVQSGEEICPMLCVDDYRVVFDPDGTYIEIEETASSQLEEIWQFRVPHLDGVKPDGLSPKDKAKLTEKIKILVKKFHNLINYGDADKAE